MKAALMALTGFGNTVLRETVRVPEMKDIMVLTRQEKGPFPYYPCEPLTDLCRREGIRASTDLDLGRMERSLAAFEPTLILVATFPLKIPKGILDIPPLGTINIHPSLLPEYRGPTPTQWAIITGARKSGVTYHLMSEEIDMGHILFQRKVSLEGLTDGELRKKLADLSGKMLNPFLKRYTRGELLPRPQTREEGSYYPRVRSKKGIDLLRSGCFNRENLLRGLTPHPGIGILE